MADREGRGTPRPGEEEEEVFPGGHPGKGTAARGGDSYGHLKINTKVFCVIETQLKWQHLTLPVFSQTVLNLLENKAMPFEHCLSKFI